MSDTTAYLAGCATTGVAALVLLVARVGMVSANPDNARVRQLDDRLAQIEATTPSLESNTAGAATQKLEGEIRRELDKQKELTQKLESQLVQQETLSSSLEEQLKEQEDKTTELLAKIQDYQRSVEDMEIDGKIAAASRPIEPVSSTPTSLIFLGAGVVIVLFLGGGGLIVCVALLILQSQRRSAVRPMPMPPPLHMPPASPYQYYDQTFLPPAQVRPRRPNYYDYPPSPCDYHS
ncbi:MAG: V-type ATPase 116kDa subunit family [Phormidesmis priestleyi Ana]|uniref:V-type ATPase 116kDa subunit family n=1 Tax=Phormidesmis priestleyi Ana TaxID=1666911 RepID=A0A0P8DDS9_9CYAN|nr:MAG: V-type ATPase 116kDa subunit family [Phormidesmis priestleyi Ana]